MGSFLQDSAIDVIIVGAGAAGTAIFRKIVEEGVPGRYRFFIIEKSNEFGPGIYSRNFISPELLMNIAATETNVFPDNNEFYELLRRQPRNYLDALKIKEVTPDGIYNRWCFGDYLGVVFKRVLFEAREKEIEVFEMPNTEVISIDRVGHRFKISVKFNDISLDLESNFCFITTGHSFEKDNPAKSYYRSPWPNDKLKSIGNRHVGMIGTRLSSADTAVALAAEHGEFVHVDGPLGGTIAYRPFYNTENFKMTMMSRTGTLPEPRGYFAPIEMKYLNEESINEIRSRNNGVIRLDEIFHLFMLELEHHDPKLYNSLPILPEQRTLLDAVDLLYMKYAYEEPHGRLFMEIQEAKISVRDKKPIVWQNILDQAYNLINECYHYLPGEDMMLFDQKIRSPLMNLVSHVPVQTAEKIHALMACGKLSILAVGDRTEINLEGEKPVVSYEEPPKYALLKKYGPKTDLVFDALIDTTGQKTLKLEEDGLYAPLVKKGLVTPPKILISEGADITSLSQSQVITENGRSYYLPGGIAVDDNFAAVPANGKSAEKPGELYVINVQANVGVYPLCQSLTFIKHAVGLAVENMFSLTKTPEQVQEISHANLRSSFSIDF